MVSRRRHYQLNEKYLVSDNAVTSTNRYTVFDGAIFRTKSILSVSIIRCKTVSIWTKVSLLVIKKKYMIYESVIMSKTQTL